MGFVDGDAPAKELIARCVHCGLCLPTCPTFAVLGLEADSPRGRIRLMKTVWDGRMGADSDDFELHSYRCLDCRACETACPSGVEFGKLMEATRSQIELIRHRGALERLIRALAFRELIPHPGRLFAFAWVGHLTRILGGRAVLRLLGRRVELARRLGELLDLLPDRAPRGERLPKRFDARGQVRGRVALFTGCVMRAAFTDTNAATARVLARNGIEVLVPERQTCCGALHAHAGERADARALARANIEALERLEVDAFIVNAAGCGANLKEYGWLLKDDPAWRERAEAFAGRVKDATEYLSAVGLAERPGRLDLAVTYDDPCHLIHGQRISAPPRELIQAIPGVRFVELGEASWCCGSAGTYNVTQPELSRQLLHRKIEHVTRTGADVLVSANPGCQMQIAAGLRAASSPIEVMHVIDLLDRSYGGPR